MRSALLLVAALNGLAFNAFAQNASTATLEDTSGSTPSALADLPPAVRNDISRACLPVQYQNGAAAYRECVQDQIDSRTPTYLLTIATLFSKSAVLTTTRKHSGVVPHKFQPFKNCQNQNLAI